MRNILIATAAALMATTAIRAQEVTPAGTGGSFDIGIRSIDITGDPARAQRYRDLSDGLLLDGFRFDRQGSDWRFESQANHLGRSDQKYSGAFWVKGKVKASFTWDQIPLFFSADTSSPYRSDTPGVFHLDPALRQRVVSGQLTIPSLRNGTTAFDTQLQRNIGAFALVYSPSSSVDVSVGVKQTRKQGTMPWSASFAMSDAVEIAAPIDTKTTDVNAAVQWAGERGLFRVGYDGSWFDNNVTTLIWDNPLRLTDTLTTGSQGQEAFWPSNHMQSATTVGSLKLPGRSRLTANVTMGLWQQNEALLPVTINTAMPAMPLPRTTAEAEARTIAMNYVFTSRPADFLWVNARYRSYDFDNRTPIFSVPQFVVMDQTLKAGEPTEPISYTRRNADVDASVTPIPFTAVRIGFSHASNDRTHRLYEQTDENTIRVSADAGSPALVMVRAIAERAERRSSGFDAALLPSLSEQPGLRHYDIADRDRNRITGLVQLTPIKVLQLSASAAYGRDDYLNSGYGLRNNDNRVYTLAAEATPGEHVVGTASYTRERYSALQNSQNAVTTPAIDFTDTRKNWSLDTDDAVDSYTAGLDLLQILPRTDFRFSYDLTKSNTAYVYTAPANTTLAPFVQLPPLRNDLERVSGDLRFYFTKAVAIGAMYWYERYTVDDFSFSATTISSATPGALFLGSMYRPYTVNALSFRLICNW